eukprot:2105916-Rhodomonas_salina.3
MLLPSYARVMQCPVQNQGYLIFLCVPYELSDTDVRLCATLNSLPVQTPLPPYARDVPGTDIEYGLMECTENLGPPAFQKWSRLLSAYTPPTQCPVLTCYGSDRSPAAIMRGVELSTEMLVSPFEFSTQVGNVPMQPRY